METSLVSIGRHRFLCGDLTTGALPTLMGDRRADIVYTDPPWGPGMLQAFATEACPGSRPWAPWPDFLDVLAQSLVTFTKPGAPLFVEMGLRWETPLRDAMQKAGAPFRRRWDITWASRIRPSRASLQLFGGDVELPPEADLHGSGVPRAALAGVQPGMFVLDPCIGLGTTLRVAAPKGASVFGLELVPARLERTLAWLRNHRNAALRS